MTTLKLLKTLEASFANRVGIAPWAGKNYRAVIRWQ